jgi:RNA polymerase sigma factor (sigma-70 family)
MPPHTSTLLRHLRRLTAPAIADAALLARWHEQRDEAAFADLVARHGPMVLGVCRRVLGDVQHAEDAFQATFLVLARKAAGLRRPQALASFLYGTALRLARKARGAIRRQAPHAVLGSAEPADPHPHPLDALSGRELLALVDEEVARLPEVYRLPVLLCVLQERPVEEAARLLGWSAGSVRGRLARGRERLRQRLTRRGLALSVGALALLVPTAVPQRLVAATVHNLAAPAPVAVAALATGSVPALKLKAACLGLLLAMVGLAAGLPVLRAPESEARPAAAVQDTPAQPSDEPRRDSAGDPLPAGAITRLGTLRYRIAGEIEGLAISPDGATVAVSSHTGLVLFDAASGKRIKALPKSDAGWGHETCLVFSPDSKRVAARGRARFGDSGQGVMRVWELADAGKPRNYLADHAIWVGWSAGGEPLAICLEPGGLRLHELKAGRSRRIEASNLPRPEFSDSAVSACAAGGGTLAVAEENRRVVHVWDTVTGQEHPALHPKGESVFYLAVSPSGSRVATCTRETVQLWDVAKGEALYTVESKDRYRSPLFSADGKLLAVTESWHNICFWDTATGREVGRTRDQCVFATHFALSADGKTLAAAEYHAGAFHLFDVATGKQKPEPAGHRCRPHGTAFTPDGRRVATGGSLDGTIHIWDLETGESVLRIQRQPQWVRDVAFSPDGRSLFSTWTDENLWIWDAASGERRHMIKLEDPDRPETVQSAISMHLSADGKTLVAFSYYYGKKNQAGTLYDDTLITGWDTSTRQQLFRRRQPGQDSWIALSADARVLARAPMEGDLRRELGGRRGPMRLEDVATGEQQLTFPAPQGQTWPIAFSPDGRLLASDNSDHERPSRKGDAADRAPYRLRLWETATAAEVLSLPATDFIRAAFSADGRLLAMNAAAQEILVWDLARGRPLRRFKGFDADVTWLAFAPDSRRLISGLADSTLLVWDLRPREPAPAPKLGPEAAARALADLAGAGARRAFRARGTLASSPEETVTLLKEHLHPARPADPQGLRRLLAELGSDRYAAREKAQADLEALGDLAEPALRQALASKPTLEVRRRVQRVLDRLRGPLTRPEVLRQVRAVAVLEDIATPAARQLLEGLAAGAPGARLTHEAQASVDRLRRMPATR